MQLRTSRRFFVVACRLTPPALFPSHAPRPKVGVAGGAAARVRARRCVFSGASAAAGCASLFGEAPSACEVKSSDISQPQNTSVLRAKCRRAAATHCHNFRSNGFVTSGTTTPSSPPNHVRQRQQRRRRQDGGALRLRRLGRDIRVDRHSPDGLGQGASICSNSAAPLHCNSCIIDPIDRSNACNLAASFMAPNNGRNSRTQYEHVI